MESIILIGSSGHAKVCIDLIEKSERYKVIGLLDSFRKPGEKTFDYPVLGDIADLPAIQSSTGVINCFIAVGDNWTRSEIYNKLEALAPNLQYPWISAPGVYLGKNMEIGRGTVLMPGVIVNAHTKIADFCILNTNSSIDHDCSMGAFSSTGPSATLGGNVRVGDYSHIGIGAIVKNNIQVGSCSVIGAGAVVLKDQPDGYICYGQPCMPVRTRNKEERYM